MTKCFLVTFLQALYETSSEEEEEGGGNEGDGEEASKLKMSGGIVDVEDMGKVSEVLYGTWLATLPPVFLVRLPLSLLSQVMVGLKEARKKRRKEMEERASGLAESKDLREMVTPLIRKSLTKQGWEGIKLWWLSLLIMKYL